MSRQKFITRLLGEDQERELRRLHAVDVLPYQVSFIHSVFVHGRPSRIQTRVLKTYGRRVHAALDAQVMGHRLGGIGAVALLGRPLAPWPIAAQPPGGTSAETEEAPEGEDDGLESEVRDEELTVIEDAGLSPGVRLELLGLVERSQPDQLRSA